MASGTKRPLIDALREGVHHLRMSTVAEIEAVVPNLSVEELAELERFIHQTRESKTRGISAEGARSFITRTHDFRFKPGIDLSKLGQLADEL